jgi:RNA polymerase sigma-70 factor (ECF subfamily)
LWPRPRALDGSGAGGAPARPRDRLAALHALAPAHAEDGPAEALLRSAEREELRRALLRLPAAQRETVTLAYARELSSAEIAERTHVGRATARSRLRLGLGKLRADMGRAA